MKILFPLILFLSVSVFSQSPKIFGHKFQKVYYVGECAEYDTISDSAYIKFASETEAQDKGFKKAEKCTILEKPTEILTGVIGAVGDKSTKTFYDQTCDKWGIKAEDRINFDSRSSAEKAGYRLASDCIKKPVSSPQPAPSPKPQKQSAPKLGKTLEAHNILALREYTEGWLNRKIIIDGYIEFNEYPDRDNGYSKFRLSDRSGSMFLQVSQGKGYETLRKAIVINDGRKIRGRFTFILVDNDQYRYMVGLLTAFALDPEEE